MASIAFRGSAEEIISTLEREREWVSAVRNHGEVTEEMRFRRDNLVAGCVTILGSSPLGPSRYRRWTLRNAQWVELIRDPMAIITPAGNKAMLRLVDVVLSDLGARIVLDEEIYCAPLEVAQKQKRRVTDARRQQLADARAAKSNRRERDLAAVRIRRNERLRGGDQRAA